MGAHAPERTHMKRMIGWIAAVLMIAGWGGAYAAEQAAKPKGVPQTSCPVMGGAINKALYAEVEGQRIYVCCPACIAKIEKDPATYLKKLAEQGVAVEKAQVDCPIMGGKINKALYVDHEGKRLYVCCGACLKKAQKDPALYLKKLEAAGIVPAPVPPAKAAN